MDNEGIKNYTDAPEESAPVAANTHREKDPTRHKLQAFNWLKDLSSARDCPFVMVQFKNIRTGFYRNEGRLPLKIGDTVVVEASPGHDVGTVMMVGRLVEQQMRKANLKEEPKKVYRIARQSDIEKFEEAKAREHDTMIQSRKIAESLELNMKIGDVEYQGDGAKAIFYYIADERVDFRKLIRILADTFKIRVEMRQIGARQEAGRIGGIGPCGRPLCCATWMNRFVSVGTSAPRFQDISMNPQKLAGQCAKLKCCLNFEVDAYMESQRKLPPKEVVLQTQDNDYFFFKADILARKVTYSTDKSVAANLVTIDARRAFEIIALNKQGVKVEALSNEKNNEAPNKEYVDLVGQDSLTRFDKAKKRKKKKNNSNGAQQGDSPRQQHDEHPHKPKQQKADKSKPEQRQGANRPQRQNKDEKNRNKKQGQHHQKPHQEDNPS